MEKIKDILFRLVVLLLIVGSLICAFVPASVSVQGIKKKELSNMITEAAVFLADCQDTIDSKKYIEKYRDEYSEVDIFLSEKNIDKFFNSSRKILKIVKDGKITRTEMLSGAYHLLAVSISLNRVAKLDEDVIATCISDYDGNVAKTVSDFKNYFSKYSLIVCVFASIAFVDILIIVMAVLSSITLCFRRRTLPLSILFIFSLINLLFYAFSTLLINCYISGFNELMEISIGLSLFPYISVVLVFWALLMKVLFVKKYSKEENARLTQPKSNIRSNKVLVLVCGIAISVVLVYAIIIGAIYRSNNYKTPIRTLEKYSNEMTDFDYEKYLFKMSNNALGKERRRLYKIFNRMSLFNEYLDEINEEGNHNLLAEDNSDKKIKIKIIDKSEISEGQLSTIARSLREDAYEKYQDVREAEEADFDELYNELAADYGEEFSYKDLSNLIDSYHDYFKKLSSSSDTKISKGYVLRCEYTVEDNRLISDSTKIVSLMVVKLNGRWVLYCEDVWDILLLDDKLDM